MRKILVLFLFSVILVSMGAATNIDSENVSLDLQSAEADIDVRVSGFGSGSFNYITTYPVEDDSVSASLNGETVECDVSELPPGSSISCDVDERDNFTINLNFEGDYFFDSRDGITIFSFSHNIFRSTDEYNLEVVLPENADILDDENTAEPVVQPTHGQVFEGDRVRVVWNERPEGLPMLSYQILYEEQQTEDTAILSTYTVLGLILFLIGVVVAGFAWSRKKTAKVQEALDNLGSDELEVVEMLRENDGEKLQKDVVDDSDYSKAKISGVVSKLVDKDIIEKEKEGRSNKLVLKEEYQ